MYLKSLSFLIGAKLFTVNCKELISKLTSASRCISLKHCFYLTIDITNNVCSFYDQGLITYNVTSLQSYVMELTSNAVFVYINISKLALNYFHISKLSWYHIYQDLYRFRN